MARISDEDIQRVRDATDLVTIISERIVLKQKGRLFWGLCPFHGEKTPSFKVDPATQLWHCFGCGKGGDAFGFVIESDRVEFPDAVRLLAERAKIDIVEEGTSVPRGRKDRLMAACEEAASYYHRTLLGSRDGAATKARSYLASRGFGSEVAKTWKLGYAPGRGALVKHLVSEGFTHEELVDANLALKDDDGRVKDRFYERIMFPIKDLQGRSVAFGGRVLEKGEPKYLNTTDTPIFHKSSNMFGIEKAKASMTSTGTVIVVEGYTDVIALHQAGITNVVATLGTALTAQHVKLLGRFAKRVVYLFDGDEAGMRAADRASEFVDAYSTEAHREHRLDLNAAIIPDGLDPADYVAKRGKDALLTLIEESAPLLRFSIDRRLARWDLERPEERSRALREAAEVLAPVKGSILADDYANYIADRLGVHVDFETIKRAISSARVVPKAASGDQTAGKGVQENAPVADTPRIRVERELLALLAAAPKLRGRARELLEQGLFSTPRYLAMAEALADAGGGADAKAISGILERAVPGSASELAAARLKDDAPDAAILADGLLDRVKEFELERRIAVGRAKLRDADASRDSEEYDALMREVSALQRELDALRAAR